MSYLLITLRIMLLNFFLELKNNLIAKSIPYPKMNRNNSMMLRKKMEDFAQFKIIENSIA